MTQCATADGAIVYDDAGGDQPPCLVFAPVGVEWFRHAFPAELRDLMRLIVVAPRGTGGSTIGGVDNISVQSAIDDLEAVRTSLGIDRAFVFGHSVNGLLALAYAEQRPDVVRGVIAVGTPPAFPVEKALREQYWDTHASDARKESENPNIATRWHDFTRDYRDLDACSDLTTEWVQRMLGAEVPAHDWQAVRAAVRCPVLIVLGASDFLVPPPVWEGVSEGGQTRVEVFPASGHTPFYEEPDRFVAVVQRWLEANRA